MSRHKVKVEKTNGLFSANGRLEFVAIDILRQMPCTVNENHYVIVMIDRYSTLTHAMPIKKTSLTHVDNVFTDSLVVPSGIPVHVLTNNGARFTRRQFPTLCTMLCVRYLTATAYHPQTKGQFEQYDHSMFTRLRHYVAKNRKEWNMFVQPLKYAYSVLVYKFTDTTLFSIAEEYLSHQN